MSHMCVKVCAEMPLYVNLKSYLDESNVFCRSFFLVKLFYYARYFHSGGKHCITIESIHSKNAYIFQVESHFVVIAHLR